MKEKSLVLRRNNEGYDSHFSKTTVVKIYLEQLRSYFTYQLTRIISSFFGFKYFAKDVRDCLILLHIVLQNTISIAYVINMMDAVK